MKLVAYTVSNRGQHCCSTFTKVVSASKMSLINTLYHGAFKRTSTFFLTVMMGTFVFEKIFDEGMDNLYANVNQGVSMNG